MALQVSSGRIAPPKGNAADNHGGDEFTTVIDITSRACRPRLPTPAPMTVWQPPKLYTSGRVIDFVRRRGGVLQVYYDDLEIYTGCQYDPRTWLSNQAKSGKCV